MRGLKPFNCNMKTIQVRSIVTSWVGRCNAIATHVDVGRTQHARAIHDEGMASDRQTKTLQLQTSQVRCQTQALVHGTPPPASNLTFSNAKHNSGSECFSTAGTQLCCSRDPGPATSSRVRCKYASSYSVDRALVEINSFSRGLSLQPDDRLPQAQLVIDTSRAIGNAFLEMLVRIIDCVCIGPCWVGSLCKPACLSQACVSWCVKHALRNQGKWRWHSNKVHVCPLKNSETR